MSFGIQVKEELCNTLPASPCCTKAEALGVLLYCNTFTPSQIKITTQSPHFAQRLPTLFQNAFSLSWDTLPDHQKKSIFSLNSPEKIQKIFQTLDLSPLSLHIPFQLLEDPCCRLAFCKGAFLSGGSITDPQKHYHLELITSHHAVNQELPVLLHEDQFFPKPSQRKGHFISYFKQAQHIVTFLTAIGAPKAAQTIETSKEHKSITSSVNRQVNCDAANLSKAVDAAQSQIKAIRHLEAQGIPLPEKLKETALLRIEYPHCTLTELAEYFTPPLSKSALNHRLRKIIALSQSN